MRPVDIGIVVPTLGRGVLLIQLLESLLAQGPEVEVVVVDQTPEHDADVERRLSELAAGTQVRWIRWREPALVRAMNCGLRLATRPIVLFLDDDAIPAAGLLAAHAGAYEDDAVWAVAGQVLGPGETVTDSSEPRRTSGLWRDLDFRFTSSARALLANCMALNLSVRRERALQVGGFDENFVGVAHRFETDLARRLTAAGGRVLFEPAASVRHVKAPAGGIRVFGDLRRSASPAHGVGDYYFALRHGTTAEATMYSLRRLLRQGLITRYLMSHPWHVPARLLGEFRALALAHRLRRAGPRLLSDADPTGQGSSRKP